MQTDKAMQTDKVIQSLAAQLQRCGGYAHHCCARCCGWR